MTGIDLEIILPFMYIVVLVGFSIGCLTSHSTIFQLHVYMYNYMTAHKCAGGLNGRAPDAIDIPWGSLGCPADQDRAMLSVFQRLDPFMAQWKSKSPPKDYPFAISLDCNSAVQIHCANGIKTVLRLLRRAWVNR